MSGVCYSSEEEEEEEKQSRERQKRHDIGKFIPELVRTVKMNRLAAMWGFHITRKAEKNAQDPVSRGTQAAKERGRVWMESRLKEIPRKGRGRKQITPEKDQGSHQGHQEHRAA